MVLLPERITELRALRAACWAMVLVLLVFPPVTELMRFVLIEPAIEDAALVTARWAIFFFSSASFWRCFSAAASSFRRCFSAAASSFRRCFSAAAYSF